ncbi:MAG: ABC transporter permease subunit [Chloroflexi bacterium]|nr:ABC transporter permease subunit [Chloroflexota bacterium]
MNLTCLQAIVSRELLEIRKNRMLLFTIFFPPLLLTVLPIIMFAALGSEMNNSNMSGNEITRYYSLSPEFAQYAPSELMQLIVFQQFLVMYLIMPLIIPMTVAAYSIIGEKQSRSLEPLLATPIRTGELLLGKSIAAVIPAVVATWLAYALFFAGAYFIATPRVFAGLLNPMWIIAMILLTPLLALLAVSIAVVISSKVNDTRVAQQIGGMLVIPAVGLGIAQTAGFILLNAFTFVAGAVIIALIDVGVLYLATKLFQREKILTEWK